MTLLPDDVPTPLVTFAAPYLGAGFDHLLLSFHGVPVRHLRKADPTRAAAPVYLGKDVDIVDSALSPDGRWLLIATTEKGAATGTEQFAISSTDELLDLLATVAYDHAQHENGRTIRWKVDGPRRKDGLAPENLPRDAQLDWLMDRFAVNRTH